MEHSHPTHHLHVTRITLWSYWPIFGIYLLAALGALGTSTLHHTPDYMSHFMGLILLLFGLIKLSDVVGFAEGFRKYDPLARHSLTYAQVYPFLEMTLGILFLLQLFLLPATLLTLILYSASLTGAINAQRNNESLHCVCLGTYFKLPLSIVTILEAGVMVLMCLLMLTMFTTMTSMVM